MLFVWVMLGSFVGISAMVALNVVLRLGEPARLSSLDEAVERLDTDAVGFQAGPGVLAQDGSAALVEENGGQRIGLLKAKGDEFVIRYIGPGLVRAARLAEDARLTIRLNDFTFPPFTMAFADAGEARIWADKLNAMQE
ncbi:hypothetical protein [Maricaulis salignorans]|uniref:hypothetical protein n=1 Tax=Maricaulis salignorans TaxID=144026 RepID=UPI003A8E8B58